MSSLQVGVIGAGYMGKNHLRVLSGINDVSVVCVSEPDRHARENVRKEYDVQTYVDYKDLLNRKTTDAVIITVPTSLHFQVAKDALNAGKDILLEKPISASSKDGYELLRLADKTNRVLMVGHTERFNPMVKKIKECIDNKILGRVLDVRVRRLSPYPGRKQDVGVLLDLATHDLDILRYLFGRKVGKFHAFYRKLRSPTYEDVAVLILTFKNNVVATINVSWVTMDKIRDIAIEGDRGMLVGNYLTQDLRLSRTWIPGDPGEPIHVSLQEPLVLELEEFFRLVRERDLNRKQVISAIEAVALVESVVNNRELL